LNSKYVAKAGALIAVLGIFTAATANSYAETTWKKNHPRREQVNRRLHNQSNPIHNEVKSGKLTPAQAQGLHQQDGQIRQEERSMAAQHGGHITKQEQATLNRQENAVSKQIGK